MEIDSLGWSTAELAQHYKVQPQSVLSRLSRCGSYFGHVPKRLPNGKLYWPREKIEHSDSAESQAIQRAAKALSARLAKKAQASALTSEIDTPRDLSETVPVADEPSHNLAQQGS